MPKKKNKALTQNTTSNGHSNSISPMKKCLPLDSRFFSVVEHVCLF